jgi:hypothetical protein
MRVFRPAERFVRVFHRLFGVFVPGKVVALSVTRRGSAMCMCRLFVELCGSLV